MHATLMRKLSEPLTDTGHQRTTAGQRRRVVARPTRTERTIRPLALVSTILAMLLFLASLSAMAGAPVSGSQPGPTPAPNAAPTVLADH